MCVVEERRVPWLAAATVAMLGLLQSVGGTFGAEAGDSNATDACAFVTSAEISQMAALPLASEERWSPVFTDTCGFWIAWPNGGEIVLSLKLWQAAPDKPLRMRDILPPYERVDYKLTPIDGFGEAAWIDAPAAKGYRLYQDFGSVDLYALQGDVAIRLQSTTQGSRGAAIARVKTLARVILERLATGTTVDSEAPVASAGPVPSEIDPEDLLSPSIGPADPPAAPSMEELIAQCGALSAMLPSKIKARRVMYPLTVSQPTVAGVNISAGYAVDDLLATLGLDLLDLCTLSFSYVPGIQNVIWRFAGADPATLLDAYVADVVADSESQGLTTAVEVIEIGGLPVTRVTIEGSDFLPELYDYQTGDVIVELVDRQTAEQVIPRLVVEAAVPAASVSPDSSSSPVP